MNISNLKVLVLGGNGFIGSNLVDALIAQGYFVRVFDRFNNNITNKNYEFIEGDFLNDEAVIEAMHGCDICFHLVSTVIPNTSNLNPLFDIESNLLGSVKLLNNAINSGIKKIIFLSSGGTVYGSPTYLPIDENHPTNPICSYGIIKLAIEKYLSLYRRLYGLDYIILRLSNPFGERQSINSAQGAVAVFLGKALQKEPIEIWGDGSVIRDYIHISDVVRAMLLTITYQGKEHIFNIGSGHGISLNDVLQEIERVTGSSVARKYTQGRTFDVPVSILSVDRAIKELNWTPQVTLMEGLTRMMSWFKSLELC